MRIFFIDFIKPVWGGILGSIVFSVLISADLISAGVLGAEPVYRVNSGYWTEPAVVSETVPIRVDETAISYDFPYEPQIIERRILSTRIISPATDSPTNSEIKTINYKPLSPLRQIEEQGEKIEKNEKKVLPEEKPEENRPIHNNSDQTESSESSESFESSESSEFPKFPAASMVASETPTETTETELEKPFSKITFPSLLQEESERISVQKPLQPPPQSEPKQTFPVPPIIRGQLSGIAGELEKVLEERPAHPQGTANVSIDPELLGNNTAGIGETSEKNNSSTLATGNDSTAASNDHSEENKSKNEKNPAHSVNGVLLLATIVSIAMLIYTVVIAFDYHQRWMQSLTAQNRRFSGLSDDEMDMDVDLSGNNSPVYSGNANIPALSRFRSESQYY
ncbi:MAG: hypothetical protein LBG58_08625 [Planctomycetaceae bacterium]|jgi:hypothetical protein|nr:hypothetical protein [Planctomycetaceae bacterium]